MNDKGTIVQQLEDERNHLLEKIRLLCSEKTDIKSQLQKMLALLEWAKLIFEAGKMSGTTAANLYDDIKTLLKEAKGVNDE